MPSLSVIIPLYNKEKEIPDTLRSVLAQDFQDYEVVVINDGSTDGSVDAVRKCEDERIRIISQNNSGVSAARNRGILESRGEYILLLDADDTLMPGAFDILNDSHDEDLIMCSFIETNSNGEIYKKSINRIEGRAGYPFRSLCRKELFIRIGNTFIRRDYLKGKEGFRTDLTLYEDDEWNYRIVDGATVYSTKKCILSYNRGNNGLSRGFKPVEKDFVSIVVLHDVKDKYMRRILADYVFRRFVRRFQSGDWKGVKLIWRNNPFRITYCLACCVYRSLR
jgi:glycosyltransferase involved in cell wall biosynthesis